MAKDKITEYDATANNNTVCGDVNIAENSALPSDMNNFAREIMSHLKEGLGSGTPLYVDQTNNRVGINKTPTVALDVSGSLSVDGGTIKLDGNYPTGTNNVALGDTALDDGSLSGNNNTAIGSASLSANTTGAENTAVGSIALDGNSTGNYNTAMGYGALTDATTGSNNTAVGRLALGDNTTASNNTALGYQALRLNTTGTNNVAVGTSALTTNTTGSYTVAVGANALQQSTAVSFSVAVGYDALKSNTTANRQVAIGYKALTAFTGTGTPENVAIGFNSMVATTTGAYNTAVGGQAMLDNTTGADNTSVGKGALTNNTTGSQNVAIGHDALFNNTVQDNNTAVGVEAGYNNIAGASNVFIGRSAGIQTTSDSNTFVGRSSGSVITTGAKNTVIGRYTGNQDGLDIRTSNNNIVLSDGDGNPRLRIDGSANVFTGGNVTQTDPSGANQDGVAIRANGQINNSCSSDPIATNRKGSDGNIILLRQDASTEGTISVSGTTVSYNGGHLSRYSQLTDNTRDNTLVKGTVMTNLDQMAEWTTDGVTEDNEQLNCMAVSSVEGDANVAGVFVNWDDDDDIYANDMNVAMTGDMVIRIAQGTTVARGDLLMSAGDGTAKPQGDDIVRSKTIAKVTSTNVSHTYDDGTYLVPCVLMAC